MTIVTSFADSASAAGRTLTQVQLDAVDAWCTSTRATRTLVAICQSSAHHTTHYTIPGVIYTPQGGVQPQKFSGHPQD